MQHDEDDVRVWMPEVDGTIRSYTSTLNTIHVPVVGSIHVPLLKSKNSLADNYRLAELWSGKTTFLRFMKDCYCASLRILAISTYSQLKRLMAT